MGILFGSKYKNEKLISSAEHALTEDPTIDMSHLEISSEKGIVKISGKLKSAIAKRHAIEAVTRAFQRERLAYDRILDEIELG